MGITSTGRILMNGVCTILGCELDEVFEISGDDAELYILGSLVETESTP